MRANIELTIVSDINKMGKTADTTHFETGKSQLVQAKIFQYRSKGQLIAWPHVGLYTCTDVLCLSKSWVGLFNQISFVNSSDSGRW